MIQWTTNDTGAPGRGLGWTTRPVRWNWLVVVPGAAVWTLLAVSALLPAPREDPASHAHLATLAARTNQSLPWRLDAGATIVAASARGGVLVYTVRLADREAGDVREEVSQAAASLARWECADQQLRPCLDRGVTIRHVFEDRTGSSIATRDVSRDDCGS
jgi:hypothetical protein